MYDLVFRIPVLLKFLIVLFFPYSSNNVLSYKLICGEDTPLFPGIQPCQIFQTITY
jgi:hypothetical protein